MSSTYVDGYNPPGGWRSKGGKPTPTKADRLRAENERLRAALTDALESLKRLPDVDGAYRVTCIGQAEKALAEPPAHA